MNNNNHTHMSFTEESLLQSSGLLTRFVRRAKQSAVMLETRLRTVLERPEEGAVTAEYAVVLIAATGFAALLVVLLKSDTIRDKLMEIVMRAFEV